MEAEASMKFLALSPQNFWFLLHWNEVSNMNEQQEFLHFKWASVFFLQILQQCKRYDSGTSGPLVGPFDPPWSHKTHPCYLHFVTRTNGCRLPDWRPGRDQRGASTTNQLTCVVNGQCVGWTLAGWAVMMKLVSLVSSCVYGFYDFQGVRSCQLIASVLWLALPTNRNSLVRLQSYLRTEKRYSV